MNAHSIALVAMHMAKCILGGSVNLRNLSDYRGDELVDGIVHLVQQHRPLHVSLVGGEPLVRHRELSRVLPILSSMKVHTMVVTSAVIPIPLEWMSIPRVRVTVSVDGLPEHHDVRRKPATYDRILKNIAGCQVNMHGTITRPMLERPGYIEEYISFWNARPEVARIWISLYTPQKDEHTSEMLTPPERDHVAKNCRHCASDIRNCWRTRAFLGRSVYLQPIPRVAHFPECPRTILLIWRLESSPAFSAAIQIARNAVAQLAADCTGSRIFAWQVS